MCDSEKRLEEKTMFKSEQAQKKKLHLLYTLLGTLRSSAERWTGSTQACTIDMRCLYLTVLEV